LCVYVSVSVSAHRRLCMHDVIAIVTSRHSAAALTSQLKYITSLHYQQTSSSSSSSSRNV